MSNIAKNSNTKVSKDNQLIILIMAALLASLSIVFKMTMSRLFPALPPYCRISFENMPVVMAGMFFGPIIGAMVGFTADSLGCIASSHSFNPYLSIGFILVGLMSGLVSKYAFKYKKTAFAVIVTEFVAHLVGSMIIKTFALHKMLPQYKYTTMLTWRIPIILGIIVLESAIIIILLKNKAFAGEVERITNS